MRILPVGILGVGLLAAVSLASEKAGVMPVPVTGVTFSTDDKDLQRIFDTAEKQSRRNILQFDKYKVLLEGCYSGVFLETQPMGGLMWGKRDLTVARNNILIFADFQRPDGGLPIDVETGPGTNVLSHGADGRSDLHAGDGFGLTGYCFPEPAFELYFWLGKDKQYLQRVYAALAKADAWLWKNFDKDKTGFLEFQYINEDGSLRFFGTLGPSQSMDSMALSYGGRSTLARIARELGDEAAAAEWQRKADAVREKVRQRLWRPERHACYDRDRGGKFIETLVHNNLRCMYFGLFDQAMADEFIRYHLLNTDEFWTPMPLPTLACNDPLFKNWSDNSWTGQPEALTYQRSFRALENYGHWAVETMLGRRFLDNLATYNTWPQQWDPLSGRPNQSWNCYGPALLSSLEYLSHLYGVDLVEDRVLFSGLPRGRHRSEYTQRLGDATYTSLLGPDSFRGLVNGREVFSSTPGVRVVTDRGGNLLGVTGIDTLEHDVTVEWGGHSQTLHVRPNENYALDKSARFARGASAPFYFPDRPTIARQFDYAMPSLPCQVAMVSDFPDATIRYTTDGSDPTDTASAYNAPVSIDRACKIKARAFRPGHYVSAVASAEIKASSKALGIQGVEPGLRCDYYELPHTEGVFPDLAARKPISTEVVAGFENAVPQRKVDYAMRFTGVVKVPSESLYRFAVQMWMSNANCRLYIDNQLVYSSRLSDNWSPRIGLGAGWHEIRLVRGQDKNLAYPPGAAFKVQWRNVAAEKSQLSDIPDEAFGHVP